jgi:hypothetical protein
MIPKATLISLFTYKENLHMEHLPTNNPYSMVARVTNGCQIQQAFYKKNSNSLYNNNQW